VTDVPIREYFDGEIASVRRELGGLKELLRTQIEAVEDSAKLALDAADKATDKADATFEKRMDTTNEWRGALDDVMKRLATIQQFETLKERVDTVEKALTLRIDAVEKKVDALLNKIIGFGFVTVVLSAAAVVVAVVK